MMLGHSLRQGGVPMLLSRGSRSDRRGLVGSRRVWGPVGLEVAEHGEDDVAAAPGEADDRRVVLVKGTDLSIHDRDTLDRVAAELNGRPRKALDWDTPAERISALLTHT